VNRLLELLLLVDVELSTLPDFPNEVSCAVLCAGQHGQLNTRRLELRSQRRQLSCGPPAQGSSHAPNGIDDGSLVAPECTSLKC